MAFTPMKPILYFFLTTALQGKLTFPNFINEDSKVNFLAKINQCVSELGLTLAFTSAIAHGLKIINI